MHPKVWVLRYEAVGEPPDGQPREQRLRVLIASRNLTFDASWDTVVRLDEARNGTGAFLGPVGNLFEGLLHTAVDTVSPDHRDRVGSLSGALATARFALPGGAYDLRIHVLGLSRTSSPLPTAAERALIISPFVSDDFFSTVHPERVDELVSRPESLDLLGAETLKKNVVVAHVFDDGSTPDVVAEQQRLSLDDPGRPLVGLHAKVFAFEKEGRARLFLGSANATGAAFNKNVEILIELAGPATELGIDRLCEGTGDEQGLRVLFHPTADPTEAAIRTAKRRLTRRGATLPGCCSRGSSSQAAPSGRSPIGRANGYPNSTIRRFTAGRLHRSGIGDELSQVSRLRSASRPAWRPSAGFSPSNSLTMKAH